MAKRQNFVIGSTSTNIESQTPTQLNHAWDPTVVLRSNKLNGVFNAVSDYSNDSSNEIANAIQSITGAEPTGATESELANALQQMRTEIETTSLTFKGYVSATEPSSTDYVFVQDNLWINASEMPTTFPVPSSDIKRWNGTAWVNYNHSYTPADFDFFRNVNDNEGYYWFGGQWTIMSTDMSTTYFSLNAAGKWEIKSNVNLPGAPTTTTASDPNDNSTKIATTAWVQNNTDTMRSNCIPEIPQDINLELNNGTLTLKAGSKVYVPNGVGVFDELIISSDLSKNDWDTYTGYVLIFINASGDYIYGSKLSECESGTSSSSISGMYYRTGENYIYPQNNSANGRYSFPIALVHLENGAPDGIYQVFNGFGYIGSTVFAVPGVKGLIPDGRNADGTLKNTSFTTNSVLTRTIGYSSGDVCLLLSASGIADFRPDYWTYDEKANYLVNNNIVLDTHIPVATCSIASGILSNWVSKTPFHAVDYNEADFVVDFQRPTAANNYTWYRKYKSGWVEQGGRLGPYSHTWSQNTYLESYDAGTINFLVSVDSDSASILISSRKGNVVGNGSITSNSTATLKLASLNVSASSIYCDWEVKGMAERT